ncbi:MAG: ubiquitin-like protein Pup [Candidatus Glassbacteria bacterium]
MRGRRDSETRKHHSKSHQLEKNPETLPRASDSRLAEISRDADERIKAAEEAIERVLSGDSERFLQSFVQEGGE